nr:hypothetical protein [Tanacetum cinerariifolium]
MSNHTRIYVTRSHTKKILGNMKRVGKDFFGRVTPLFLTMMAQAQEEMGKGTNIPTDPQHTPTIIQLSTSQPLRKPKPRKTKRKDTQIDGLERKVKKLEKKQRLRTHKLKRLYKVGLTTKVISSSDDEALDEEDASKQERIIDDLDADEDITLMSDQEMFDADKDLQGGEVVVEQEVVADKESTVDVAQVSAAATTVIINDITLAKALEALKTSKPKIIRIVIKDHEETSESRTTTTISSKNSHDKGKAKMIEIPMKLKKNDQILFDEEVTRNLQEEINEEERLVEERARQEEEDITLDHEEPSESRRTTTISSKKSQDKGKANIIKESVKLKKKDQIFFDEEVARNLQEEINKEERLSSKKVKAEITHEESSKRAGDELEQETTKKQKIVDDKETTNLKQLVKIIPEDDIVIDVIPLAIKTLIRRCGNFIEIGSRAVGFSGVSEEWLWEECGVVGCQENGEKKEENGAICLGGKE